MRKYLNNYTHPESKFKKIVKSKQAQPHFSTAACARLGPTGQDQVSIIMAMMDGDRDERGCRSRYMRQPIIADKSKT
jgi:hypothetical protein